MRRIYPILGILLIAGCSHANAGFFGKGKAKEPDKVSAVKVGDDPAPEPKPVPTPAPDPLPPPMPVPQLTIPPTYDSRMGLVLIMPVVSSSEMLPGIIWEVPDNLEPINDFFELKPGAAVFRVEEPGQYRIRAIGAQDSRPVMSNWCIITVHGPRPPPVPPQPVPVPDPIPPSPVPPQPVPPAPTPQPDTVLKASKLWIVLVYDSLAVKGGSTDPFAAIINDMSMWNSFTNSGHEFSKIDVRKDPSFTKFSKQIAENKGIPCVILMDAQGSHTVLNPGVELRVPDTVAGFKALVQRHVKP